jgi:hypothetical protein
MAGPKTLEDGTQATLASPNGTRAGGGKATATPGWGVELLVDLEGRIYTADGAAPFPTFPTRWQVPNAGGAETRVLLAAPGILEQVAGFVLAAPGTTVFMQLFDLAAGPPGAAVPFFQAPCVGTSTYSYAPGRGWQVVNGILIAVSTTADAYTAGAGAILRSTATGWQ